MGSLPKNTQLMLEFLKAPFLVLHFSYYTLMTFLIMLFLILLSMLIILFSILNMIRHLICGNNLNWLLNLNLIYDTVDWGRKWLVDINAGKTWLVLFDWFNNTGAIDVKLSGSVLKEKLSFVMLELTFFSNLGWDSCIISIAKTSYQKIGTLICFFLLRLLCISINLLYALA